MTPMAKDAFGAVVVALISLILVILLMGSIVMMGYGTGRSARTRLGIADADTGPNRVPVLCYHYLRGNTGPLRILRVLGYVVLSLPLIDDNETWTISAGTFEKHMRWLTEHGYHSVSLDDVARWKAGLQELPRKPVVITFDDGDRSVHEYAWPVLQKYGLRATMFVVTEKVGQKWKGIDNLSWAELREMHDSGIFDIESHTHDMHFKVESGRRLSPVFLAAAEGWHQFEHHSTWDAAVREDLATSRGLIRRHIGVESRFLAWPYGSSTSEVNRVAFESGFVQVVDMIGGTNQIANELASMEDSSEEGTINRFAITARTSMRTFVKIVRTKVPDWERAAATP